MASCEPLPFKFTPDGMSNGKVYYENNLDPVRTRMGWGGSAWYFQTQNDNTNIGFEFASTVDVGIEPPCFESGNWQFVSGDGPCSATELTAFYFNDGRCNPVPTLTEWRLVILGLILIIFASVALRQFHINPQDSESF